MTVLRPLLFPSLGDRIWALTSDCKIDQSDFTDWICFLRSSLTEGISSNLEALNEKYL